MILLRLFWSFVKIGFTSFGGMSMIPLIASEVTQNGWMTADQVVDIIAIAEATPGPIGLNASTFAGMNAAGIPGALAAAAGIATPTLTIAFAAAVFYSAFKTSRFMQHLLLGIRPGCVGLVAGLMVSMLRTSYVDASGSPKFGMAAISAVCLVCLMKLKLGPQVTIFVAAGMGILFAHLGV